jgi:pyruvate,water dikinase
MGTKHVFWFTELGQNDNGMVGKKCANLGELTKLRMPVPRGFAISVTAEDKFLEETGARGEIRELVRRVGDDELKDFNVQAEVSRNMQAIIEGKEIPPDLAAAIVSCYEDLCARSGCVVAVSVRSAGVKSHPGMYETYLNIRGTQQVLQMVRKVWASIFNHRTVSAAIQHGLRAEDSPSIGVGVVELVNARGAGVCFTVHPVTGDPHTAVIESNWGLGESVVSGVVNVDRHVIDKRSLKVREKTMGEKKMQIVPKGNGVSEEEVPPEKQAVYVITDEEAAEIVKLAMALEVHFNHPQDIEWAIDADRQFPGNVLLLQVRGVVGVEVREKTPEQKLKEQFAKIVKRAT